jgi:hypothetical protein
MVWWAADLGWERAAAAAVLLLALPGVWGPQVVRPVGVDLPAMAVAIMAVACFEHGLWPVAVLLILVAASIKETAPVFAAVWAWHPIMLIGLIVPAVVWFVRKPQIDQVTAQPLLRRVYEHPVITAMEAHRGRWRDAWLMVAPWGATLAALYRPSWQTLLILVLAYAQLLVATDTVRLLHTAAGPVTKNIGVSQPTSNYKWNLPPHRWSLPVRPTTMDAEFVGANNYDPNFSIYNTRELSLFPYRTTN